ncbi:MAG: tetratricopeptide repeat protein, partial [Planctomycetota bacterium]
MSASLFLASILFLAPLVDEGDDRYHFISGLAEKGLNEMVVKEATRFLEEFPDHARIDLARYRLASALFDLSRLDAARPHFAALAALDDFRFRDEVAFRSGQCELEAGDHDAAARAFERARSGEADYLRTSATFLLAEAHFRA